MAIDFDVHSETFVNVNRTTFDSLALKIALPEQQPALAVSAILERQCYLTITPLSSFIQNSAGARCVSSTINIGFYAVLMPLGE